MSDTSTAKRAKKARYTGEVNLSAARPSEVATLRKGADLTQYENLLTASWNLREQGQNHTMEVPIPTEARTTVESRLRQAGVKLGVGVATGVRESDELPAGHVFLLVQANPKKVRGESNGNGAAKARKASKGLPPVGGAA